MASSSPDLALAGPVTVPGPGTAADRLAARIDERTATVGVLGMGYVGLPLAGALHAAGFGVVGFDVDKKKAERLTRGEPYLEHLGPHLFATLAGSDRFEATHDMGRLGEVDVVVVCVPTPLGRHQEPDLGYVTKAGRQIGRVARPGQLVVLESTTYPSTTREILWPAIDSAASGALVAGEDIFVAYSPEREDPGRSSHDTRSTPKLVGGLDPVSTDLAARLYRAAIAEVIEVSSAEVAEAAKVLENVFRAVNIALVNEMKVVLTDLGIDVWEVIDAASTKPFGFMRFEPGPGLGGHCIPIDPFYLTWKAKEIGRPTHFIELAGQVNNAMPDYVVERITTSLNDRRTPVRDANVLIVGLAYKPDVDDVRESPSFELIDRLRILGARVTYHDPHVASTHRMRRWDFDMASVPLTPELVAAQDVVVIATAHSGVDYGLLAESARLVIDTRNVMAPYAEQLGDRLQKA